MATVQFFTSEKTHLSLVTVCTIALVSQEARPPALVTISFGGAGLVPLPEWSEARADCWFDGTPLIYPGNLVAESFEASAPGGDAVGTLMGSLLTHCPSCGKAARFIAKSCTAEFAKTHCRAGHTDCEARVLEVKRAAIDKVSGDQTYTFRVELYCRKCNSVFNRFLSGALAALGSVRRIKIGPTGIELERTPLHRRAPMMLLRPKTALAE